MKIHEFQAKELFQKAGVTVLRHVVARSKEEAAEAYDKLGTAIAVVKAQIHAGGRGKGTIVEIPEQHGVQLVKSREEAAQVAGNLLGNTLVTIQTGAEGKVINQVLIEEGCDIARELYLGIVLDRAVQQPVLMCSTEGGVEIEKVAEETPELIHKEHFDPSYGLQSFQVRKLCQKLGIGGASVRVADRFMKALCRLYVNSDCSLVEINPLVVTTAGDIVALDAKVSFDSNSMYRQKDIAEYRDVSEEEPTEVRAAESGLSYIKLDGNIACLVNGAGLAMSTMDIIKLHGASPANFLDVGGGADKEQVTEAFRILLSDPNVKAVLVNIFGGIARCSTIAKAIVAASQEIGFEIPLVVRLEGTEVEEGRRILEESDVAIITATDLTDAATKVVAAISG
ncbi:MAG: ADP-forming succinate--CoA ligase subunit beta [Planctomycetaceae bacterium]|mgnify:FL=1|jgi:succinyl-CoA synthetase beta subunit|nr:ADP-forming succinate--CoA ligase subunit beta [Planctomycetaceae bacterium]MBT4724526.1 ADP-forming succinate--CoA ligase subunit beta [Planctomycetaceae bacterium]MBT4846518.1 ADP-forming succinate--CoA ligase subunit beta [Planctomycetaceae bacterium]MBT5125833.1 ADP-forming succinate--CoA ligase subunit beta [Planctomycetaceae bacterium]MBT5598422.1 ADP-forming succinate--CoA ligase subunit beta [Planctomycetaceae bacterium]